MRIIRHWLRLPLFTKRELRNLNGFWWAAATKDFTDLMRADLRKQAIPLDDKQALLDALDEFMAAVEWIEEMKA